PRRVGLRADDPETGRRRVQPRPREPDPIRHVKPFKSYLQIGAFGKLEILQQRGIQILRRVPPQIVEHGGKRSYVVYQLLAGGRVELHSIEGETIRLMSVIVQR